MTAPMRISFPCAFGSSQQQPQGRLASKSPSGPAGWTARPGLRTSPAPCCTHRYWVIDLPGDARVARCCCSWPLLRETQGQAWRLPALSARRPVCSTC